MEQLEQYRQYFDPDGGQLPVCHFVSNISKRHPLMPHWHDWMEIFYVTSGRGTVKVNLEERRIIPGDVVVVTPGCLHSLTAIEDEMCICHVVVFDLNLLLDRSEQSSEYQYIRPIQLGRKVFSPVIPHDSAGSVPLCGCIDKIIKALSNRNCGWELLVKSGLLEILATLWSCDLTAKQPESGMRETKCIKQTLRYIENHWNEPLNSSKLADVAGYSIYHFQHMFRRYVGYSPAVYIRQLRLSRAAVALLQEQWPVSEVCYYAGFHTVSYFIDCFRRQYGMTPRAYRNTGGK